MTATRYNNLPKTDQPSHRLRELGPQTLNTAELIATALGINNPETAQTLAALYHEYGGWNAIPRYRLLENRNMGNWTADAITAIGELARRELLRERKEKTVIHSPEDAAALVMYEMSALEQEQLRVILLDTRNQVIDIIVIYQGSVNSAQVRVGELFKEAVRRNATAIVAVHNHPAGDPSPSPEDIALTRSICQAGSLMDIQLLDHIVIGKGKYLSLKERGLGF